MVKAHQVGINLHMCGWCQVLIMNNMQWCSPAKPDTL